jgi:SPOR domain
LSAVIGDRDPSLLGTTMRSRGSRTFYQVRIGADTRPAADDLCNRIRRAGGACFVLRNFRG